LCDEVVLPVGSPDLIRSCRPTSPEALRDAPLIHLITRPRLWADWFAAQDIAVDNAYTGLRLDQFSMIIEGAVSGLGFALLPSYLVERELRSGALKMLFDLPLSTENSYYVVVPEKKQANETVKLFTQWLLAQVGGGAESLDTV
jgi:DNA-binding transcriptional LysR family regulator